MKEITLKKMTLELCRELFKEWQNDSVKGLGYGTQAEKPAVRYAFEVPGMTAVNADTLKKNTRSARVLEKAGFAFVEERGGYRFYRIQRQDRC